MDTKLFSSPFKAIADNISKNKVVLTQRNKDYLAFINFLDSSNKDLKKIKLPNKRQIKSLAISGGGFDLSGLAPAAEKGGSIFSKQMRTFQSIEKAGSSIKREGETSRGGSGEVEEIQSLNSIIAQLLRFIKNPFVIGTALLTAGSWAPEIFPELVGEQERISDMDLRSKDEKIKELEAQKANLNLFDILLGKGSEIDEQLEYLKTGKARNYNFGSDSAVSGEKGVDGNNSENNLDQRLKEQERAQRAAASKTISFADVTDKFDKIVSKFEDVSKGFGASTQSKQKSQQDGDLSDSNSIEPTDPINTGNSPESTGIQLEDVESSGGEVPGSPNSGFRTAHRPGHNGNDYFKNVGTPISLIQEGTVTVADMNYDPKGWGAVVEVRHKDGSLSRYAHLSRISVAPGSKITPGQVIGYTGGSPGAPGAGNSEGPHLHFEYLPAGSGQVNPTEAAKKIFRFGGNVRVKSSSQRTSPSGQGLPGQNVNTLQRQQSISDFIKGTQPGNRILNDPNLKSQLTGQSPATDAQVKQMREAYDGYVRSLQLHQVWNMQVNPSQTRSPLPPRTATPSSGAMAAPPLVMINNQGSSAAPSQPQMVPIPIPTGGRGGGGGSDSGLSVGEVVNSFAKLILLTNLSGS